MEYHLYTDGATSNNGTQKSYGGYGWILLKDNKFIKQGSGGKSPATNNICELTAVINGCKEALNWIGSFDKVIVYSDSAYIINCYNQKWYRAWEVNGWINSKKQPVANKSLWEDLILFFEDCRFDFRKVKGHAIIEDEKTFWNNYVDKLAVDAKICLFKKTFSK